VYIRQEGGTALSRRGGTSTPNISCPSCCCSLSPLPVVFCLTWLPFALPFLGETDFLLFLLSATGLTLLFPPVANVAAIAPAAVPIAPSGTIDPST
jgi:hypothetical protein